MARPIYSPPAQYSDSTRKAKIRGDVLLEAVIASDGTVREARVLRPLHPDLDANALRALKTWRFEPATKDGNPVAIRSQISLQNSVEVAGLVHGPEPTTIHWKKGGNRLLQNKYPHLRREYVFTGGFLRISRMDSHLFGFELSLPVI